MAQVNKESLEKFINKNLKDRVFFIVTNREPYAHIHTLDGIELTKPSGGVHTLLNIVAKASHGYYVAFGHGSADKEVVDKDDIVKMPPREKLYSLKRVFLSKKELENYYYGFANQMLWPLSHAVFVKPEFNPAWWEGYQKVNQKFAQAILNVLGDRKGFIWVNDYHFSLLPKLLRESGKDLKIGTFWHIPWPTYEIFRVNPWAKEILAGLLGGDFLAFHQGYQVENFLHCIQREIPAKIEFDLSRVTFNDHETRVEALSAGLDYDEILEIRNKPRQSRETFMKNELGFKVEYMAIGVDRMDYTKGLIERLKMVDRFLEKYPQFIEKFVYFGISPFTRLHIPAYRSYSKVIVDLAEKINWKYYRNNWTPIVIKTDSLARDKIIAYYKFANTCLVTALDDGLNLVAKEFVLSCKADKGMLVLSKFTGAAKDLRQAILINPYNIEEGADAIYKALTMTAQEKKQRNQKMREELKRRNIYSWAIEFINKTLYD